MLMGRNISFPQIFFSESSLIVHVPEHAAAMEHSLIFALGPKIFRLLWSQTIEFLRPLPHLH